MEIRAVDKLCILVLGAGFVFMGFFGVFGFYDWSTFHDTKDEILFLVIWIVMFFCFIGGMFFEHCIHMAERDFKEGKGNYPNEKRLS